MGARWAIPVLVAVVPGALWAQGGQAPLTGPSLQAPLTGLWDLTITDGTEVYPSWLDISENGGQPRVRIVGRVEPVHPADQASLEGGRLTFMSKEYFGRPTLVIWELQEKDGRLTGTQRRESGETRTISGEPAPALDRPTPEKWSSPQPLLNGVDLAGWESVPEEPGKPVENHYVVRRGELVNEVPGANLRTARRFDDFKLHFEVNCPEGGDSGVYLRGRYELRIKYGSGASNDAWHSIGSINGFLAPSVNLAQRPGRWESFDVTLVGRIVTVARNGKLIHDREVIPGITGGALDSREGEPGPIYIRGDRMGLVKYRNITISVPES